MRNAFSKADDQRLVEYLAKYNPGIEGRHGKLLYQRLAENSWAKSHPWQSWRERYKKNTDIFDPKIARYLKEQKEATRTKPPTKPASANGVERAAQSGKVKIDPPKKTKDVGTSKRDVVSAARKTSSATAIADPKDLANASADSGYASAKVDQPDASKGSPANGQSSIHGKSSLQNGRQQRAAGGSEKAPAIGTQSALPNKPAEPAPVVQSRTTGVAEAVEPDVEKGESATDSSDDDDYVHELFGSYKEEEEEEDQDVPPSSSAAPAPTSKKIYPDAPNSKVIEKAERVQGTSKSHQLPGPSHALKPPQSTRKHPLTPIPAIPEPSPDRSKRPRKRKDLDDDPFVDTTQPPSSPPPAGYLMELKAPPVLKEGPFRNTYVPARHRENDDNGVAWPPKRRRKDDEQAKVTQSQLLEPSADKQIGPEKHQRVNAVASSSKVMLSAVHAMRPDDPLLERIAQGQHHGPQELDVAVGSINVRQDVPAGQLPAGGTLPAAKRQKTEHHRGNIQPVRQSAGLDHEPPGDASSPTRSEFSLSNAPKGKARAADASSTIRIDLREQHKRRPSLRSSKISSRASSASVNNSISKEARRRESTFSSGSRRSRHSVVRAEDAQLIPLIRQEFAELGKDYGFTSDIVEITFKEAGSLSKTRVVLENLQRQLPELGRKYGFSIEVVENTFRHTGSLEKTQELLKELNRIMKGAQDALFDRKSHLFRRGAEEDLDDEMDGLIPEGLVPRKAPPAEEEKEMNGKSIGSANSHNERPRDSLTKRSRPSLIYKPITADETEDMSDYSPPSKTRARRYTKLRDEGREEEALAAATGSGYKTGRRFVVRESEDTDGGEVGTSTVAPHYHMAVRRGREPSSPPELESSPTPAARFDKKHRNIEEEDDGPDDNTDVSMDSERRDRPSSPEDADQKRARLEYKKLASEVTVQNQKAMLEVEKKIDPLLVKQWSLELIEERFAVAQQAHEARKRIASEGELRVKEES